MTKPKSDKKERIVIEGGYILVSRKIIESEIFRKPPLYLKVWIYLLSRAQHKDFKKLKRGQLWTSIPEIQEACSHYVGFRKEIPSKDQIFRIIDWLRFPYEQDDERDTNATMIATTKATRGLVVNVLNYCTYQDPKNYESNDERNNEKAMNELRTQRDRDTINKNDKNDKNDKDNNELIEEEKNQEIQEKLPTDSKEFIPPTLEQVSDYCKERNNTIDPEAFIDYYQLNEWFVGKGKNKQKMKDWKASVRTWERNDKKKVEKLHERNNTDDTTVPEGIGTIL